MPSTYRLEQLNKLLREEINNIFLKDITFPNNCLVTISSISTSKDLGQSRILVSVLPAKEQEAVFKLLKKSAGFIQYSLSKKLVIWRIPKLIFEPDFSLEKASQIDTLIDKIHHEG